MKEKFSVTGMTCSACSAGIERTVSKLNGVKSVEVSLMGERMSVEYDETVISREKIMETVVSLGYGASEYNENLQNNKNSAHLATDALKNRFFFSVLFLLPLMYFSMGGMVGLPQPIDEISFTVQAVLAAVIIGINFRFFTSGVKALLKKVPNMDTLVALGSAVSYIYSLVLTVLLYLGKLAPRTHIFYESAAMILALVTLGKWLEEKSKRKTGDEVEKLIRLMPNQVTVERGDVQSVIAFSEIVVGDIIVVKQGDYIPVDGKILSGSAFVDRAAITGESLPIEVLEGDLVTGADIVKSGYIKVLAEKVGADTTLSQIVKMVKEAGASKAPIQKIADKIAGIFVPLVTLIAAITFFVWMIVDGRISVAANYAISVLVISCPCSLGLATPVAIMAATGRGMSLGILYKDAEALQKAKDINCVLLDKTATLTVGAPQVTDFLPFDKDETLVLSLAYALEMQSNHPIAECIKTYVENRFGGGRVALNAENYVYETGKGAVATVSGTRYFLGNRKLLTSQVKKRAEALEKEYAKAGKTLVFLATEQKLLGVFAVADTVKETSAEAISLLKTRGIKTAMLTGDSENVAKAVASRVGIEEYFAEALPKDKAEAVQRVRAVGGFVAMVGDGINDSPALKEADVGVAMGAGTDIAIDSADVVLVGGDLRSVSKMIDLSKATVKNIKENLFWAFFYNCVAIPVAAGALSAFHITLNPMIAAACMSLSSLFVVTNALRLTRFGKKKMQKNSVELTQIQTENPPTENAENIEMQQEKDSTEMKKTVFVEGMMCMHCVGRVKKALEKLDGVLSVDVSLENKNAVITFHGELLNDLDEKITSAIVDAGYEIVSIQ